MTGTILLVLLASLPCGDLSLESPVYCGSGDSQLYHYDDGTAYWLTWSGQWRGVWFTMDDFGALGNHLVCDGTQFWFYHHSSYGWDSSTFYAELWTDGSGMPETLLSQETVIATHYSADWAYLDPPIDAGNSFWVLVNTTFSSGGWPSSFGDNTPQPLTSHSFHSDNFLDWDPWIISGTYANDYFVRAHGSLLGLEESSWAGIKALFR